MTKYNNDIFLNVISTSTLLFCSVKLGELEASLDSFQNARDIADSLEDDAAEIAIAKAINDVQNRINGGKKIF